MSLLEADGRSGRTYIIGEAGVNHNGKLETAMRLVDMAKVAGVDAIKFQTFNADLLVSKKAPLANYQKRNTKRKKDQLEMIKELQLEISEFRQLKRYCDEKGLEFLSTPFDIPSVDALSPLVRYYKVPSGEVTNLPFLKHVASKGKPIILSTGMSDLGEVEQAISTIRSVDKGIDLFLLHCVSNYPCRFEDVNLKAMVTLRNAFGLPVGYSDHTEGIVVPIAAVALGAVIIEKHFTLDKTMIGPDHKFSLDPSELQQMVTSIRHLEVSLGDGIKRPNNEEAKLQKVARKSLIANNDLKAGHIIRKNDIAIKRPGDGISPKYHDLIVGKRLVRDILKDEKFSWAHFMSEE